MKRKLLSAVIVLFSLAAPVWAQVSPGIIEEDKLDEKLMKILPKITDAANQLIDEAKVYLEQKKLEDAIKLFNAAIKIAPMIRGRIIC